jgi:hypothetical protein
MTMLITRFDLESPSPTIFDGAVYEIEALLKMSVVPKFLVSNTFNMVSRK